VQGPVTVFLMAIPVIFSLMALLKVELASGMLLANRVAQALAAVTQQLVHLNAREDLRIPLDQLMVGGPLPWLMYHRQEPSADLMNS